ncbi:MAG: hypothetical protein ACTSV6_00995, partial [Candidatus Heimdallarchaeota archaeon]
KLLLLMSPLPCSQHVRYLPNLERRNITTAINYYLIPLNNHTTSLNQLKEKVALSRLIYSL